MTKEEIQKLNDDIYTDHFTINEKQYGHHYPGSYLLSISRMRYSANQVEEKIPQNILEPIIEAFRKEENLQKRFFKIIVDERMSKNALP